MSDCTLNTTPVRLISICRQLTQPLNAHPDFRCKIANSNPVIILEHKTWGILIKIEVNSVDSSISALTYHIPELPSAKETEKYQAALLFDASSTQSGCRRYATPGLQTEELLKSMAYDLAGLRAVNRGLAMVWFFDMLKIWGIEMVDRPQRVHQQDGSYSGWSQRLGLIQEPIFAFDFIVRGSPAEFAVIARESISIETRAKCIIQCPETYRVVRDIPSDINPVGVHFQDQYSSLWFVAHRLMDGKTLLKTTLSDNNRGWKLWNSFRDVLERFGWFSLTNKEEETASINLQIDQAKIDSVIALPTEMQTKELSEAWLTIPDRSWDRECLRLWHHGLTCKDIGLRLQKNDKTVLNRLNQLRKKYGEQTVPYRNVNFRTS